MQNDELQRSHLELEQSRDSFSNLFDFAPAGYLILDIAGRIEQANLTSAELLGIDRAQLHEMDFFHFLPEEYRDSLFSHLRRAFRNGTGQSCELEVVRGDGSRFHAKLDSVIQPEIKGDIPQCLTLVSDITVLKQAEEALRRARDELEIRVQKRTAELVKINQEFAGEVAERRRAEHELQELNETLEQRVAQRAAEAKRRAEELEQFAYVVSHDLKAPLRGVATLAAWLQDDLAGKLNNETGEQLVLLQDRVGRMHSLIEGLLEYSRIGRMQGTEETVDTKALVDEIIDSLSLPKNAVADVAPDMPTLHTNRLLLGQVFANLVGNAIKHHEGSQAHVWVTVRDTGKFYEFSVADDGPGIAPQYHQKVFMMFQTLATRDVDVDSGIGLALVKKIVEERGGSIELDSEEGKGATIRFTWPK